jgi:hypothetical protein
MGLKNSPAIMQQYMHEFFPDEMPYIDNITFGTKGYTNASWPVCRERIIKNFDICRKYNLKLNLKKCVFQLGKIETPIVCLGRLTTGTWNSIDDKTSEKIKNMVRPKTVTSLKSALAQLNWIRKYVQHYGQLAAPLYKYTTPEYAGKKIRWSDEYTTTNDDKIVIDSQIWTSFITACAHPEINYYCDDTKAIYCCGDACNEGFGFIIFQLEREDLEVDDATLIDNQPVQNRLLIAINSGSFNKDQRKWSVTDRECYAFYKGIMDNRHLLYVDHLT